MNDETIQYSAIVAMSENGVIGHKQKLPWHLPADLKHFKEITLNHTILMGRKTFLSIGKPLPQRTNLIMTKDQQFIVPGCVMIHSEEELHRYLREHEIKSLFVIGGAEIFARFMPLCQRLYLTVVHHTFVGDTYFNQFNKKEWQEIGCEHHTADESNAYDYSFYELIRK